MASTKPLISNASVVSQTVPPVFTWAAQGGSDKYYNINSFGAISCEIAPYFNKYLLQVFLDPIDYHLAGDGVFAAYRYDNIGVAFTWLNEGLVL